MKKVNQAIIPKLKFGQDESQTDGRDSEIQTKFNLSTA